MKPHKHAELIKAWADGAKIERLDNYTWIDDVEPIWYLNWEYRIKPEPKQDVHRYYWANRDSIVRMENPMHVSNLELIFDGHDGYLKQAKVLMNFQPKEVWK